MANKIPRVPVREQDPKVRATNFEEVCYGYNAEEAQLEASRCLNCKNPRCVAACPVSVKITSFISRVAEGKFADLIMIDLHQPNMQPINNIVKNIVYSGSKQNVKLTMVDGKVLYENGEFFIGTPEDEVYAKANEIINRMRG